MSMDEGKRARMKALADERGIIAGIAMDQRGSLQKALASTRGVDVKEITPEQIREFKTAVTKILTPHASAITLDPEFGLEAAKARSRGTGLLLSYEVSGYDSTRPGRMPDLLKRVSVRRLVELGADGVKILMYYSPDEEKSITDAKHAFLERVGSECEAWDIPFFLQFVGYDPDGGDERGVEYARAKPVIVRRSMEEFSKPRYGIDVLKVEVPVNAEYVEGTSVYKGQKAYSRQDALNHFREAAAVASKPFIYLSAGVGITQFTESLRMAAEAGAPFSGVLCGRAIWKGAIPAYAGGGLRALEEWLRHEGVRNVKAVNDALRSATPWYVYAGVAA